MLALLPMAAIGAAQQTAPKLPPPDREEEPRLPDGRLQRDEILKADYDKSLQDAADLQRLSTELRIDLEKATAFVVPVQAIKKTEEIEKIAKRIRGRLKH